MDNKAVLASSLCLATGCILGYYLSQKNIIARSAPPGEASVPKWPVPTDPDEFAIYEKVRTFALESSAREMDFPIMEDRSRASQAHRWAELFGVGHKMAGTKPNRYVKLYRTDGKTRRKANKKTKHARYSIPEPPTDPDELQAYEELKVFVTNDSRKSLRFTDLNSYKRAVFHRVAEQFDLGHRSMGWGRNRALVIEKIDPAVLEARRAQEELLRKALEAYNRDRTADAQEELQWAEPQTITEKWQSHDGLLRYANWNIEWMDYFFQSDETFHEANFKAGISNVAMLCRRIAGVVREMGADVIAIEEGPANAARLALFVHTYLDDAYDVLGGLDGGAQQLYFLVKKNGVLKNTKVHVEAMAYLAEGWQFDVQGDCTLEEYKFTRRPLVISAEVEDSDEVHTVYMACMHTKSKYVGSGARMWAGDPEEKQKFIRKAVKNRRRIAAECARTRRCLDQIILKHNPNALIIVSGDMNDGPGMDFFEDKYLLFDSIDCLLGSPFAATKRLHSVMIKTTYVPREDQWSIVFDDYVENRTKKVLLDHVFVSDALRGQILGAHVGHELFDKHSSESARAFTHQGGGAYPARDDRPSDHCPVFVDFSSVALTPGGHAC